MRSRPTFERSSMRVAIDEAIRPDDWEATFEYGEVVSDIYETHFQVRFVILDIVSSRPPPWIAEPVWGKR